MELNYQVKLIVSVHPVAEVVYNEYSVQEQCCSHLAVKT